MFFGNLVLHFAFFDVSGTSRVIIIKGVIWGGTHSRDAQRRAAFKSDREDLASTWYIVSQISDGEAVCTGKISVAGRMLTMTRLHPRA